MSYNPSTSTIATSGDVVLTSPQNSDVLTYESSTSRWKNKVPTVATDATIAAKGIVQLAGDLAGTATLPTVPGLAAKAPLASPAFTGTPTGITKTHVGLANVDNTSDASKPVSAATQTALNFKANLASPTFTGTVTVPAPTNGTDATTKTYVDTVAATTPDATALVKGKVQLAGDLAGTAALPTVPGLAAKAPLASPAFTGTPTGITKTHVGLANVDNTSDASKPVSAATQTALNLKADTSLTVLLAGTQTVTGTKTFSISPIVPTPTTGTQAATKAYADSVPGLGPVATARSASYTAANNDFAFCNATSGAITVTLPAPTDGARVRVLKNDPSANAVTVVGNAIATLAGSTSFSMNVQWMSQDFAANGTSWYCI